MYLVEKHIIDKHHRYWREVDNNCFLAKNLFNYANYLIRQKFIFSHEYINYNTVQKICQSTSDYKALPAKVSQQVLIRLCESWQSFKKATNEYVLHPEKFLSRPKLPKYKHKESGRFVVTYTSQAISKKQLKKGFIHLSGTNISLSTKVNNVHQVRVVPRTYHYVIEVVYFQDEIAKNPENTYVAGVDIGLDNLAAITANSNSFQPILLNGKPLKNINAYYNKKKACLQSRLGGERKTSTKIQKLTHKRNCQIIDYLHKASRLIVDYLAANRIGTLVIGKNDLWKQSINLGNRTNQNFVCIPHAQFIEMLTYKCQLVGISVVTTSENYTSKCSFIDFEPIEKHEVYLGKRVKRGLFRSSNGFLINADCNGSGNIVRKVVPAGFC
ncbi:MAG: transposase [Nostocales cyanobacterium 94392]|nr:transposase [Nostocales cyanobacterium 94392]